MNAYNFFTLWVFIIFICYSNRYKIFPLAPTSSRTNFLWVPCLIKPWRIPASFRVIKIMKRNHPSIEEGGLLAWHGPTYACLSALWGLLQCDDLLRRWTHSSNSSRSSRRWRPEQNRFSPDLTCGKITNPSHHHDVVSWLTDLLRLIL